MKCADPVLCYTSPTGKKFYRHFSLASIIIKKSAQQVFNCGQCISCRKKKSYELACRCILHASLYTKNCFLTLTYDEKKNGYHNNFQYSDIQKFKKRLRAHVWRNYGERCEIFNVHEYGKNGKKHWHLIVFNWEPSDGEVHTKSAGHPLKKSKELERLWRFGFSTYGSVELGSAMYQTQYMEKDFKNGNRNNNKKSHSKHSGIGRPYFLLHFRQILSLGFIPINSRRLPVPRYFEKIAHKHWAHFNDPSFFFDLPHRKRLYAPFKHGEENRAIADLYPQYKLRKAELVRDLEVEWNQFIDSLSFDTIPDFVKSEQNIIYDLTNKQKIERF